MELRIHGLDMDGERAAWPVYVRGFDFGQPGFAQTSATYSLSALLERGGPPG